MAMTYGTTPLDAYLPAPPAGTIVLLDAAAESEGEWLLHEVVAAHDTVHIHGRTADAELAEEITRAEYDRSVILDDTGEWESGVTTRTEYLSDQPDTQTETDPASVPIPATDPDVWVIDGLTRLTAENGPPLAPVMAELSHAAATADGYVFVYAPTLSVGPGSRPIPHQITQRADVIADVQVSKTTSSTNQEFYISQATYAPPMRTHRRLRFDDNTVNVDTTRDIS